jgi:hypothetical protein
VIAGLALGRMAKDHGRAPLRLGGEGASPAGLRRQNIARRRTEMHRVGLGQVLGEVRRA